MVGFFLLDSPFYLQAAGAARASSCTGSWCAAPAVRLWLAGPGDACSCHRARGCSWTRCGEARLASGRRCGSVPGAARVPAMILSCPSLSHATRVSFTIFYERNLFFFEGLRKEFVVEGLFARCLYSCICMGHENFVIVPPSNFFCDCCCRSRRKLTNALARCRWNLCFSSPCILRS
jgi:hypothetical protein